MDICNKFHVNPAIVEIIPPKYESDHRDPSVKENIPKDFMVIHPEVVQTFQPRWPQSDQIFQSLWKEKISIRSYIFKAWLKIKNPAINEL